MAGPIFHNERVEQPPWASRSSGRRESSPIAEEDENADSTQLRMGFLSPSSERPLQESPGAVTPSPEPGSLRINTRLDENSDPMERAISTAPPEPQEGHKKLSRPSLTHPADTDPKLPATYFPHMMGQMDDGGFNLKKPGPRPVAPLHHTTSGVIHQLEAVPLRPRVDDYEGGFARRLAEVRQQEGQEEEEGSKSGEKPEGWGREFKIEWIRTERLPFHRTRHLRNPWNHDREVKVSRDGTELEPTVGERLLEEWDKPDGTAPPASASTSASAPSAAAQPTTPPAPSSMGATRGYAKPTRSAARAAANTASAQSMPSFSSQMARTAGPSSDRHGAGRSSLS